MKNTIFLFVAFILIGLNQSYGQCSAPVLTSFSPNTGYIGSTVTINGANFDAIPANNQVFFGAAQATIQSASFGVLTVTVPVGATTAPISVKNNCNLTGYSSTPFNGIFCPTPITTSTYQNTAFTMTGGVGAYNMLSQDIDLDGKPDIVVEGFGSGVTVAKNNSTPGSLSFSAVNFTTGNARSVAVADFDGDGKRDVFVTNTILPNTSTPGNVTFGTAISIGTFGYQIATGDINNDGRIDLIGEAGNNMFVMRNTSTGPGVITFAAAQNVGAVGTTCTGIQAADVDGDGKVDILASQGNLDRCVTLRNTTPALNATFSFDAAEAWPSNGDYPYRCALADFDKDGKIDLTTCNYQGATNTAIYRNTSTIGDISFDATLNLPAPTGNYRIVVGDVNGDGYADIVTKSLAVNVFSVYPNTSTAPGAITFGARFDYTSSAQAEVSGIAIGDLDGDFVPDIATSGVNSNTVRFHRNTSAQVDNTNPTAACKNITVALSPSGSVTVTPQMIDNGSSDACGLGPLQINGMASVTYTCSDIGQHTVTLNVTDLANNTATCTSVVTVSPAAIIVAGQTTVCQGQTVPMSANTATTYQWNLNGSPIPGETSQNYVATISGSYTVTVTNPPPGCSGTSSPTVVTVNNNPTVTTTPSGHAFLCPPSNTAVLTASSSSLYQWQLNGVDISGATQQSYTATTAGSYTVKVIDVFGCSATSSPIIVYSTIPEIDVSGNAMSISDGDNTPSLLDGTDYGTTFPATPVTHAFVISNTGAHDLTVSGISMSGADAANFTVGGMTFPATIPASGAGTFTLTFNGSFIATYNATVTVNNDDCDESIYDFAVTAEISCVFASFTTCPSNITVSNDPGVCNAVVNYTATAAGIPPPTVSYTFSGATTGSGSGTGSGSTFNKGVTTVTITASNGCGPNASCSFTVTVNDTEPPAFTRPADITIYTDAACAYDASISATGDVTNESDNCSSTLQATFTDAVGNTCQGGKIISRIWHLVDNSNNAAADQVQTITVVDNIAPTFTAPANTTIYTDASCAYDAGTTATGDVTNEADNCSSGLNATYTDVVEDGSCDGSKLITRTWQLIDNCGNAAANQVQLINVMDNTVPTFTAPASTTIYANAACSYDASPAATGDVSDEDDNCSSGLNASYTDNVADGSCDGSKVITRTWHLEDDCGNAAADQVQTINVQDNTAPSVTCAANVTACNDQAGNIKTMTLIVADNCSTPAVSYSISGATTGSGSGNPVTTGFNVGTSTVSWTITDDCGNTSTCATTVLIRPLPVATFTVSSPDAFCNAVYLTGSSSHAGPTTYAWSLGSTPYSSAQTIQLGVANSDGLYSLKVTDANGCTSNATAPYNFQKASLASSYVLIGVKEVHLHELDSVYLGAVGATASNGKIKIHKFAFVGSPGAFAKAADLDIDSRAYVPIQINSPAVVTFPPMLYNTSNTSSLSNYTMNSNGTLNGNYKDLTINNNVVATITGNVFRKIKVKKDATVTFTSPDISLESLETDDDVTLNFSGNTNFRVTDKVKFKKGANVNPGGKKVTFYVSDPAASNDNAKFDVDGGETHIIANVLMPAGKLHVHGGGNENSSMTGLFIAEKIESHGKNINWTGYNCGATSLRQMAPAAVPNAISESSVLIYPNPTNGQFTVQFSQLDEAAIVQITDIAGRMLEQRIVPQQTSLSVTFDLSGHSAGIYMVQVQQGGRIYRTKLVVH